MEDALHDYLGKFEHGQETHWVHGEVSADGKHFTVARVKCDNTANDRNVKPVHNRLTNRVMSVPGTPPTCILCAAAMNAHTFALPETLTQRINRTVDTTAQRVSRLFRRPGQSESPGNKFTADIKGGYAIKQYADGRMTSQDAQTFLNDPNQTITKLSFSFNKPGDFLREMVRKHNEQKTNGSSDFGAHVTVTLIEKERDGDKYTYTFQAVNDDTKEYVYETLTYGVEMNEGCEPLGVDSAEFMAAFFTVCLSGCFATDDERERTAQLVKKS